MVKYQQPEVHLIDSCGSDLSVANAARVSFHKTSDWEYTSDPTWGETKRLSERDKKLLSYLAKHNHWTPFAHCFVSFRVTCCFAVARQLHKHQVGLVVNEVSRRYVSTAPTFYKPDVYRGKAKNKKQGSSGTVVLRNDYDMVGDGFAYGKFVDAMESAHNACLSAYNHMLDNGVCEEQARLVLPLGANTEFIWSGSLAAWARVINLRTSEDAQPETQYVAEMIASHIKALYPASYEVLCGKDSNS